MKHHFSRLLKCNYSWLPKGFTSSIINLNARGTCSMIAALCSDGEFILQIVRSTINQEIFQNFIWIMNFILKNSIKDQIENVIINLDNASIHTSKQTKKLLYALKLKVSYLPPYSPKLAPVELFFNIIKSKIRSNFSNQIIDFSKESGLNWIYESLKDVANYQLVQLWIRMINQAKQWIIRYH